MFKYIDHRLKIHTLLHSTNPHGMVLAHFTANQAVPWRFRATVNVSWRTDISIGSQVQIIFLRRNQAVADLGLHYGEEPEAFNTTQLTLKHHFIIFSHILLIFSVIKVPPYSPSTKLYLIQIRTCEAMWRFKYPCVAQGLHSWEFTWLHSPVFVRAVGLQAFWMWWQRCGDSCFKGIRTASLPALYQGLFNS
jgi:hypothetical protein